MIKQSHGFDPKGTEPGTPATHVNGRLSTRTKIQEQTKHPRMDKWTQQLLIEP
jgi:hypothetical protein